MIKGPKVFILILFSFLAATPRLVSQHVVRGQVTSWEDRNPLPGVTIVISGTTRGTTSDIDGNYTLDVSEPDASLTFSYMGYITLNENVNGRHDINVAMMPDIMALEEFVVIGYGSARKSDITGAVSVISGEDMQRTKDLSIERALQGKVSGIYVSTSSGRPGEGSSIKVRGLGSINMNAEPLYIVDGIEVSHNNISSISPANIESISVLKDASSAAIYGTRGANGVILIQTKRGRRGDTTPVVSYESNLGYAQATQFWEVMNATQYTDFMSKVYNGYAPNDPLNFYNNVYRDDVRASYDNQNTSTDFYSNLFRQAMQHSHNLSVSGGAENFNYNVGANYSVQEGILMNTQYDRVGFHINSDIDISKRLKVGESVKFIYGNTQGMRDGGGYHNGGPLRAASIASPYMPLHDPFALGGFGGPTTFLTGDNERTNPVAEQSLYWNHSDSYWLYSNIYAEYRILEGLSYKFSFNYNLGFNENEQFVQAYTLGNVLQRDNINNQRTQSRNISGKNWEYSHLLSYDRSFDKLSLSGILGFERNYTYTDWVAMFSEILPSEDIRTFPNAGMKSITGEEINERALESYLARAMFTWDNRYFLTASLRIDGSSNIGPEAGSSWLPPRFGAFPSLSAGWNINEDLFPDFTPIDMLKLRGAWGITGNQNIQPYAYLGLLTPQENFRYTFGSDQRPEYGIANLWNQPNPGIQWEESRMTNVGIDLNMFNNKLELVAEYYIKNQDNMLIQKPTSMSLGKDYGERGGTWPVQPWLNLGRVQNKGFEFSAGWRSNIGKFSYSFNGNLTTLDNKVLDLGKDVDPIYTTYTVTKEGHQIGSYYGYAWDGVFQNQEEIDNAPFQNNETRPGDFRYKDLNMDGVVDQNDRIIIGKPLPDIIYGFSSRVGYGIFDVMLVFQGVSGYDVFNESYRLIGLGTDPDAKDNNRLVSVYNNYWSEENRVNNQTRIAKDDKAANSRISSFFVEDASFLRFKTLQLGVELPQSWARTMFIDNARFYFSIDNLHVFTNYQGLDPEMGSKDPKSQGIDNFTYPKPRTMLFGIQLNL